MNTETIAQMLSQWIVELLMPVLIYLIGHAVVLLRRWRINDVVLRAVVRGAGAAYVELVRGKEGTSGPAIEAAVDVGAAYVEARVPDTLAKAGLKIPDAVRDAVRAQLGTLLAADPTVGVRGG